MQQPKDKAGLEAFLERSDPSWWARLPIGRENMYGCDTCKGYIVTVDIDRGVTPMYIKCQSETCSALMRSYGYPARPRPEHIASADWEWYRPEVNALGRFDNDDDANEHILRGGLLLRGRTDAR